MKSRLDEGLTPEEKEIHIQDRFLIDAFKPKVCHEKDVVVLSFLAKSQESAENLDRLMARSPVSVMNIEVSTSPDPEGNFVVLGEFDRDRETFGIIDQLLSYLKQELKVNSWSFKTRSSDHTIPWNEKNFSEAVPQSPEEFVAHNGDQSTPAQAEDNLTENIESYKPESQTVQHPPYNTTSRDPQFTYEMMVNVIDQQITKSSKSYMRDIKKQLKKLVKENRRLSKQVANNNLDSRKFMKKSEMDKVEEIVSHNQRLIKQVADTKSDSQYFLKQMEMGRIEEMIRDNQRLLKEINQPKPDDQNLYNRIEIERIGAAVKDNQRILKQIAETNQDSRYLLKQLRMSQIREKLSLQREKQDVKRIRDLEDRLSYLMLTQANSRDLSITDTTRPAIGIDDTSSPVHSELYQPVDPETVIVLDEVADGSVTSNEEIKTENDVSDTDQVRELFGLAAKASEAKDYHSAIDYFTRITELKSDDPRIYYNLAILYYRLKDYDTAHEYASKAEDLGAKDAGQIVDKVEAKKIHPDESQNADPGARDDTPEIVSPPEDESPAERETTDTQDVESSPAVDHPEAETTEDVEDSEHSPWIFPEDETETEVNSYHPTADSDNFGSEPAKIGSHAEALEANDTIMIDSRAYDAFTPDNDVQDVTDEESKTESDILSVEPVGADNRSEIVDTDEGDTPPFSAPLPSDDTVTSDIEEGSTSATESTVMPDDRSDEAVDEDQVEDTVAMDTAEGQLSEAEDREAGQANIPPEAEQLIGNSRSGARRLPQANDQLNVFDSSDTIMIDSRAFDEIEPMDCDLTESETEQSLLEKSEEAKDEEIYEPLDSVKSVPDEVVSSIMEESEIDLQESDIVPETESQPSEANTPEKTQTQKKEYTADFYKLGQEALSREDNGLAIAYFTNYVELNPQEYKGYLELAGLNLKLGKYEIASEYAEQAEALGAEVARQLIRDIEREQSSAKEAIHASEIISDSPAVDHGIAQEITEKASAGQTEQIEEETDTVAFHGLETEQEHHSAEISAKESLTVKTAKDKDPADRFFSLGMEAFERKDYGLAISYFNQFVDLVPDEPRGYYNLALINYRMHNYDIAKEQAGIARKLGSELAWKILRKIELKTSDGPQKGQIDIPISKTDEDSHGMASALEVDTIKSDVEQKDGLTSGIFETTDEKVNKKENVSASGKDALDDTATLPPSDEKTEAIPVPISEASPVTTQECLERCEAAVNNKDYTSAIAHLERFVELAPDEPRGYYNLAVLYYRLKDYSTAQKQAERAKELGSDAAGKILAKTSDKLSKAVPGAEKETQVNKTQDHTDDTTYFAMEGIEYPGEVIYLLDERAATVEDGKTGTVTEAGMQVEEDIGKVEAVSATDRSRTIDTQDTDSDAPSYDAGLSPETDVSAEKQETPVIGMEEPIETIADIDPSYPENKVQPDDIVELADGQVETDKPVDKTSPETQTDRLAPFVEAPVKEEVLPTLELEQPEEVLLEEIIEPTGQEDTTGSEGSSAGDVTDHFALGTEAAAKKDYKVAIEHFSRFLESAPDEPHAYYNLAVLYYRLKDYQTAREHAERAKQLGSKAAKKVLKRTIEKLAPPQPVFEEDAVSNTTNIGIDSTTFFGVADIDYGQGLESQKKKDKQSTLSRAQTGIVEPQVREKGKDTIRDELAVDAVDSASGVLKDDRVETPPVINVPAQSIVESSDRNTASAAGDKPTEISQGAVDGGVETEGIVTEKNATAIQADDDFDDIEENLFETSENDVESLDDKLQFPAEMKQDDFDPFSAGQVPEADLEAQASGKTEPNQDNLLAVEDVSEAPKESPARAPSLKVEEGDSKDGQTDGPDSAKDYFTRGMEAYNKKENEQAITYFTKFIELKPDEPRGHYNLSILYYRLKDLDAAEKHGKRAQQLGAKPAKAILAKIKKKRKLARQSKEKKAKSTNETVDQNKTDVKNTTPAGDVSAKQEQEGTGEQSLLKGSADPVENIEMADTATVETNGLMNDGAVVWGTDDLKGEVDIASESGTGKTADKAVQSDIIVFDHPDKQTDGQPEEESDPAKKYFSLGLSASEKRDYLEAIKHFTKVTHLIPDDPRSYYNLALVSYRMKFYESAKEHANRAIDLGSKSAKRIIEKIEARKAIA